MICSLGTNIFGYCIDATDTKKHQVALALLARAIDAHWPVAAQVYGEFYTVATRNGLASRAGAFEMIETCSEVAPSAKKLLGAQCASPF